MKNLSTLVLLFVSLQCVGQKAVTASILIQNNWEDYELRSRISYPKNNGSYRESRIPSLALGYMKFQESGNYFRINFNGFYSSGTDDAVVGSWDFSTHTINYSPTKLTALGGRIGFSKGYLINIDMGSLEAFIEPTLTANYHYLNSLPSGPGVYSQKNQEYYFTLGPNFALQKTFGKFFLRFDLLMPFAQFGFITNRKNNPSFSIAQNTHSYFNLNARLLNGFGVGGGYMFN